VNTLERQVGQRAPPVMTFPNLTTAWPEFLLDGTQAHNLKSMLESVDKTDPRDITSIRIYEL
jgi:hypothetical protein